MGTGLLRFEASAGIDGVAGASGTSVERFAASSVADGVSVGCAGGGCRVTMGLREPQPEKAPTQRRQRIMKKKESRVGLGPTRTASSERLNGPPES